MKDNKDITYFAKTNTRNKEIVFGIKNKDRTKHMYIIGKTGMGKTTLQENMAVQDIRNGHGVGVIDPHGSFAEKMLDFVPKERVKDVIYLNPDDTGFPIAFNIMEDVGKDQRHLVASGLMGVFKKMWPDVWSPRMEYILTNAIFALLEYPGSTLLGINKLLSDKDYRKKVVANIQDPIIKAFWEQEFAKYTERFAAEATPAIQNKVGQFATNPVIRNIIGQPKSSFNFRKAMDEKKIVIMNLSKGRIGELNSQLIGALLVTKIYLAAMSRATDPEKDFPPFFLHVDEFQNFATESFKDILSEARKYGLALVLAHQYIEQLGETGVKEAVFGNVGTHIVFRVGAYDAEALEKEFSPEFTIEDIVNLGFANIYLKLMIDGVASRPFSAATLPPIVKSPESYKNDVIEYSRKTYCKPREEVEKEIALQQSGPPDEAGGVVGDDGKKNVSAEPPKLFEAECSVCGKTTVIPFEPDGKRPIYCQKHRSYISEGRAAPATPESSSLRGGRGKEEPAPKLDLVGRPKPVAERRTMPNPALEKPSVPAIKEGALVFEKSAKAQETISLANLREKTFEFHKSSPRARKEKPKPDIKGLRDLLADEPEKIAEKKIVEKPKAPNVLKPGDSIKL